MLKERRLYERLQRWLCELQATELFIQVPDQTEPIWTGVCDWLTGEEWTDLILTEARFDSVECLGRPSNNRPMYHFTTTDVQ
jgi:hypothetical protein